MPDRQRKQSRQNDISIAGNHSAPRDTRCGEEDVDALMALFADDPLASLGAEIHGLPHQPAVEPAKKPGSRGTFGFRGRAKAPRNLQLEALEGRDLLAGIAPGYEAFDVYPDGFVDVRDVAELIQQIRSTPTGSLSQLSPIPHDVNRDGALNAGDLVSIIRVFRIDRVGPQGTAAAHLSENMLTIAGIVQDPRGVTRVDITVGSQQASVMPESDGSFLAQFELPHWLNSHLPEITILAHDPGNHHSAIAVETIDAAPGQSSIILHEVLPITIQEDVGLVSIPLDAVLSVQLPEPVNSIYVGTDNRDIRGSLQDGNILLEVAANVSGTFDVPVVVDLGGSGWVKTFLTLDINPVNDPPFLTNISVGTLEDVPYTIRPSDFDHFQDPLDQPANLLQAVIIDALPQLGTLLLDGQPIAAGTIVTIVDIAAGKLVFETPTDRHGEAEFPVRARDDGGTGNGGVDTQQAASAFKIAVASVNDPPLLPDIRVSTQEDVPYTLQPSDFDQFQDPLDQPANNLQAVIIDTLPQQGTLLLDGQPVAAGAVVTVSDIAAGKLKFKPADDMTGTVRLAVRPQDDGGSEHGGQDVQQTASTLTVEVSPINDPPTIASAVFSIAENADPGAPVGRIAVDDPDDAAWQFQLVADANGTFAVNADTGEVIVVDATRLDYELHTAHQLRARVTDSAGLFHEAPILVEIGDLADHWIHDQQFSLSGYLEAQGSGKTFSIYAEGQEAGSLVRIAGVGSRGTTRYTQSTERYPLPENGSTSFTVDRIPGWAPEVVVFYPSTSREHGTRIRFGEVISDSGSLIGVSGGGSAFIGGRSESRQLSVGRDPIFRGHASQLDGLARVDALIKAAERFGSSGPTKIPEFTFVAEGNQITLTPIDFIEGFEIVARYANGDTVVVPFDPHADTVITLPRRTDEVTVYVRDTDDMDIEFPVGPEFSVPFVDGNAAKALHRKATLNFLAHDDRLYDQLLDEADRAAILSALETFQTSQSPDADLIELYETPLNILDGDATVLREDFLFTSLLPWEGRYYDIAIDPESIPFDAVKSATITPSGLLQIHLRDDYLGTSFDITFDIANGPHSRTRTTTFNLTTAIDVAYKNTIDDFTTYAAELDEQIVEANLNYAIADNMDRSADDTIQRYLQQIGDPSQAVIPQLHVKASRFQYQFIVDYRNFPGEGHQLRFAGNDVYEMPGQEGRVIVVGMPRPNINIDYDLELLNSNGDVISLVTRVKVIGGKISRVGAIDRTYSFQGLEHIPALPEELHVTLNQKTAAELLKLDASALRASTTATISTLNSLRDETLRQIEVTNQEWFDYLHRYDTATDSDGTYFEYVSETSEYPITVRAWHTYDHAGQLTVYDAYSEVGQTAFAIGSPLATVDFINQPGSVSEFRADLVLRDSHPVTAHFYRGGEKVAEQTIVETSSIVFADAAGISAVVFTSNADSVFDISNISVSTNSGWDFEAEKLSGKENYTIATMIAPDSWGEISSILISSVFNGHLAENNILRYRATGMSGAHQGQYFLLGSHEGKYSEYTLYTPESTQGSPQLGGDSRYKNGVLYLNNDGWHILPQRFYTFIHGALVMHPGAPTAVAVRVGAGSDVVVNHRAAHRNFDELFASISEFNPAISIQVLRQGHHHAPGFGSGIKEIQDGETPVIFNGQPFHVIATVWNTSAYSGPLVIDVYAGPESVPQASYIGRFETSVGAFSSQTLIVNAVSPPVGEGRPSITFVRIHEDGTEHFVAGKLGRKAGRMTKAEREDLNRQKKEQHAKVILDLVAERYGVGSEQYQASRDHLQESFGITISSSTGNGGGNNQEAANEVPVDKQLIALALDIDVAAVDHLDATPSELQLIERIGRLVAESKDPRMRALRQVRESVNDPTINTLYGVFKPERLEELRQEALKELRDVVNENSQVASERSEEIFDALPTSESTIRAGQLRAEIRDLFNLQGDLRRAYDAVIRSFNNIEGRIDLVNATLILADFYVNFGSLLKDNPKIANIVEDFVLDPVLGALDAADYIPDAGSIILQLRGIASAAAAGSPPVLAYEIGSGPVKDIIVNGTKLLVNNRQINALNQMTLQMDQLNLAIVERQQQLEMIR